MTTKIPVELSSTPGIVDNSNATAITIDSSENVSLTGQITIGSGNNIINAGNLTLDVGGDITLDADGGDIKLSNGGTQFANFGDATGAVHIDAVVSDDDIKFRGNDGGSVITALTLDMSEAGTATFNNGVVVQGDLTVQGTTVTLNTATLDVEDKNITLNAGSGDTSGSANGAGITIQDAVDASNNATILWDASNDEFDFSHPINVTGKIVGTGISQFADVNIPDNNAIRFGSSQDTQIFHDGSNSKISHTGTGGLYIGADTFALQNGTHDENFIVMADNGSVQLYYDNNLKLLTSSTGINLPVDGDSIKFGANSEIILTHVHDVGLSLTGALSITGDGSNATTLTESGSGDFTVDSAGDIILDADGSDITLKDGGVEIGNISLASSNFMFTSSVQDKDIIFTGNDGGSAVTALTLDMSAGGSAFFNHDIVLTDNGKVTFGAGSDLQILHDGSTSFIKDVGTGNLEIWADGAVIMKTGDGSETKALFDTNGSVDLYYDNSKKFETTSTGVDVTGDLKFNSGYGSSVIGYGVRAWVNFNGTGTVAIREDGNVSSITDNGTGDYTVNFATALPDTNYCVVGSGISVSNHPAVGLSVSSVSGAQATGSIRIAVATTGGAGSVGQGTDGSIISVAVIR